MYILLFIAVQLVSLVLSAIGIPLIAWMIYSNKYAYTINYDTYHWKYRWAWLWDNKEDGICPDWYRVENREWSAPKCIFHWAALRNSVANFKHVWGVSGTGRPLFYRTWYWTVPIITRNPLNLTLKRTQFYSKMGWFPDNGFPCFQPISGGRGY